MLTLAVMKSWLLQTFQTQDLELAIGALSTRVVVVAALILLALLGLAILWRDRLPGAKPWLFGLIGAVVLIPTVVLIAGTIYLNTVSISGGPVHWHADFEVWACGQPIAANIENGDKVTEIDQFRDPTGFLSNKIGTPVLHEHDDFRIHLEGVVVEPADASLGKFFRVVGGSLSADSLVLPVQDGVQTLRTGQLCNGLPAELSVFAYQTTENGSYQKVKLENPAEYTIAKESTVPPGDCIIFELDTTPNDTDKMCLQYKVALETGRLKEPQ